MMARTDTTISIRDGAPKLLYEQNGVKIIEEIKRSVEDWPKPLNISKLQSFMGLPQVFRRLIKDFSRVATPLFNLTRKKAAIIDGIILVT